MIFDQKSPPVPIQTPYQGILYRSRAEARWAVVLTELGLVFDYEPEGFKLQAGWYLPDFWVPALKLFLEVKGDYPNEREKGVADELARRTGHAVMIVKPPRPPHPGPLDVVYGLGFYPDYANPGSWALSTGQMSDGTYMIMLENINAQEVLMNTYGPVSLSHAIQRARNERFGVHE